MFDVSKRAMAFFAPSQDIASLYGPSSNSAAGTVVTERTAMNLGTVYACVRIIAETIASMPLVLYRTKNGQRSPATQHPAYQLMRYKPNDETHVQDYLTFEISSRLLWGNGYSQTLWRGDGKPYKLVQMNPERTTVLRDLSTKEITYRTTDLFGYIVELSKDDVTHIHGLGFDGITGKSVISLAREAVGLALGAEAFGAKFYGDGAHPGGVLTHPGTLSKPAYERLKKDFKDRQSGLDKAHDTLILEEGLKWQQITIPPDQAQFIATRTFQKSEIAQWYGVPLPLLQSTEKSSSWGTTVIQMVDGFIKFTLLPIMKQIELEYLTKLFLPKDWDSYEFSFINQELVKETLLNRFTVYGMAITSGIFSINQVLAMEGMDPINGGDKHIQPLNMKDITAPDPALAAAANGEGDGNGEEGDGAAAETEDDTEDGTDNADDNAGKSKKKNVEVTDENDGDTVKIKKVKDGGKK
jgi:HK97 family phage portal protein